MKRKICVVTGSRADYGILYSVMKTIERSSGFKLYIIATCMHLMKEFGYTVKEIEKDGFHIYEKINISYREDSGEAIAGSIGKAVSKFSRAFYRLSPDIVVILGDRGEMLAASIAANYLNIPVAHIHGGEVSGHVDGLLRHAITKLSHIHFPATKKSADRIMNLGEESWRIFKAGAPALDRIKKARLPDKNKLFKKYNLAGNEHLIILVQHPVSSQVKDAGRQIKITLEALKTLKIQTLLIYPNADGGSRKMIEVIKKYESLSFIRSFKSIPHEDYLGLLKFASLLVGNSSSALIEAPSFGLPAINIGIRQEGREHGRNIINIGHDKRLIIKAVKKAIYNRRFKASVKRFKNLYGDGRACERIAKVLSRIKLDKRLLEKRITY